MVVFFMVFQGVGKSLGQLLLKFPTPITDEDVDQLMDLKVENNLFAIIRYYDSYYNYYNYCHYPLLHYSQ